MQVLSVISSNIKYFKELSSHITLITHGIFLMRFPQGGGAKVNKIMAKYISKLNEDSKNVSKYM